MLSIKFLSARYYLRPNVTKIYVSYVEFLYKINLKQFKLFMYHL